MIVYNLEKLGNLHVMILTPPELLGTNAVNDILGVCEAIIPKSESLRFSEVIDYIKTAVDKIYRVDTKSRPLNIIITHRGFKSGGRKRLSPHKLINDLSLGVSEVVTPQNYLSLMLMLDESITYKEANLPFVEYAINEEAIICRLKRELNKLYHNETILNDYQRRTYIEPLLCTILYLTRYHSEII